MIGDAEILIPFAAGAFGHLLECLGSVAGGCVCMQLTADVLHANQIRQTSVCRTLDFVGTFAKLRWNKLQVEAPIDVGLGWKACDSCKLAGIQSRGDQFVEVFGGASG